MDKVVVKEVESTLDARSEVEKILRGKKNHRHFAALPHQGGYIILMSSAHDLVHILQGWMLIESNPQMKRYFTTGTKEMILEQLRALFQKEIIWEMGVSWEAQA